MQKSSTQLTLVQYRRSFWNNEIEGDQCDEYEHLITNPESLDISNTEPSLNESLQLSTDQASITPSIEGNTFRYCSRTRHSTSSSSKHTM